MGCCSNPDEPHFYTKNKRVRLLLKYPKDDDYAPEQLTWIADFVGRAEDALYTANFKDKTTGWRKWFDERTMADFIIVKEIVGDMDGYTSTRCYKHDGVEKIFFGPVWDCDRRPKIKNRQRVDSQLFAGF